MAERNQDGGPPGRDWPKHRKEDADAEEHQDISHVAWQERLVEDALGVTCGLLAAQSDLAASILSQKFVR